MSTVAELKEQVAALEATIADAVMHTVDGVITMAAGLEFTIAVRGGVINDTGVSHPDAEGNTIKLGDLYWRIMGTMKIGKSSQMIGIHLKKTNANGTLRPTPMPNQLITLPANVHLYRTSGSRWELYQGDKHPDERYNIDPDSRQRDWRPSQPQATQSDSAGVWE